MNGFIQIKDGQVSPPVQLLIDLFGLIVAFWTVIQILIFIDPQVLRLAKVAGYVFLLGTIWAAGHLLLRALRVGRAIKYGFRVRIPGLFNWIPVVLERITPSHWFQHAARRAFRRDWLYLATLLLLFCSFFAGASAFITSRLDQTQIAQEELRARGLNFSPESYRNALYFQNNRSLELFRDAGVEQEMFDLAIARPAPFTGRPMLHELIDRADCDDLVFGSDTSSAAFERAMGVCTARIHTFLEMFGADLPRENGLLRSALSGWLPDRVVEVVLNGQNLGKRYPILDERGQSDIDWNGVPDDFDADGVTDRLQLSLLAHALSRRAGHLSAALAEHYGLSLRADIFLPEGAAPPDTPDFVILHNLAVADPLTALAVIEARGVASQPDGPAWSAAEIEVLRAAICASPDAIAAPFADREQVEVAPCDTGPEQSTGQQDNLRPDWGHIIVINALDQTASTFFARRYTLEPGSMTVGDGIVYGTTTTGDYLSVRTNSIEDSRESTPSHRLFWGSALRNAPMVSVETFAPGNNAFFRSADHIVHLLAPGQIETQLATPIPFAMDASPASELGDDTVRLNARLGEGFQFGSLLAQDLLSADDAALPLSLDVSSPDGVVYIGLGAEDDLAGMVLTRVDRSVQTIPIGRVDREIHLTALVLPDTSDAAIEMELGVHQHLTCDGGTPGVLRAGRFSQTEHSPETIRANEECEFIVTESMNVTFEALGFGAVDLDFAVDFVPFLDPAKFTCSEDDWTESFSAFGTTPNIERVSEILEPGCYRLQWTFRASEVQRPFSLTVAAEALPDTPGISRGRPLRLADMRQLDSTISGIADLTEVWIDVSDLEGVAEISVSSFAGDIDFALFAADGTETASSTSTSNPEFAMVDLGVATALQVFRIGPGPLGAFELAISDTVVGPGTSTEPFLLAPGEILTVSEDDAAAGWTEIWIDVSVLSGSVQVSVSDFEGDIDFALYDAAGNETTRAASADDPETAIVDLGAATRLRVYNFDSNRLGAFNVTISEN